MRSEERPSRLTTVKAYSNLDTIELFVNDQRVGSRNGNDINVYTWEGVVLAPGDNTVEVRGTKDGVEYTDSAVWTTPTSDPPASGLVGTYYNNRRLFGSDLIRFDANLSLDWGAGEERPQAL